MVRLHPFRGFLGTLFLLFLGHTLWLALLLLAFGFLVWGLRCGSSRTTMPTTATTLVTGGTFVR